MSKIKIFIGILIILALLFGTTLLLDKTNFLSHQVANYSDEDLSKATLITTKNATSSTSEQELNIKEVAKTHNLENFTQGVWIKKYPENYACFKFETPEGLKIVVDPYMMNETVKPDIVTESHQHADHNDISKLQGEYKLIKETGSYIEKGIKITGYSGKHNKGDATETNIIFVYEINGIKIAHFASQGELPNYDVLDKIKNIDVLLIQASIKPEYANSKLNLDETKLIIDRLNPKIVIPEHGSENLCKALASFLGLNVEFIKNGEIVVTKSELNASEGLRILDLDIDVPKN